MTESIRAGLLAAACALYLTGCALFAPSGPRMPAAERGAALAAVVARMPADAAAQANADFAELVRLGPEAVRMLCEQLATAEPGEAAGVQYALHGLAQYVGRPGAGRERRMFARAVSAALPGTADPQAKNFLIRLLETIGGDDAVAALAPLAHDPASGDAAAQALAAIGTPRAREALIAALATAPPDRRAALAQALGYTRAPAAADALRPLATDADNAVRRAALAALADLGDPADAPLLAAAVPDADDPAADWAADNQLRYARRLAEEGHDRAAREICARWLDPAGARPTQFRCAALALLTDIEGEAANPALLAALDDPDPQFRAAATWLALELKGDAVTESWAARLATTADPAARLDVLEMLTARGDRAALPAVLARMEDEEPAVRLAAITAAGRLGGAEAAPALIAALGRTDRAEAEAARAALIQIPGEDHLDALARAYADADEPTRRGTLAILARRGATQHADLARAALTDDAAPLRLAALDALADLGSADDLPRLIERLIQAPTQSEAAAVRRATVAFARRTGAEADVAERLLQELDGREQDGQPVLLTTLGNLGSPAGLPRLREAAGDEHPAVRDAALRALFDWPDPACAEDLLTVMRENPEPKYRTLAARALARLAATPDLKAAERLDLCRKALAAIEDPAAGKPFLALLAEIPTVESFRLAASYLEHEATKAEAALAVAELSPRVCQEIPGEVHAALAGAADAIADEGLRERALTLMEKIGAADAVSLFNGRDLTGWIGDTAGYAVERGVLVSTESGRNLFTEREYGDFVLSFDFQLSPGANNGLGVRAPLEGDAAFEGLEVQILDDTAPQYAELKQYQYHGSVYGIVPAERGHLKPVGEWNHEVVIARGRWITVYLNGHRIVHADLDQASREGTMDGREHPGLARATGHLGLLGHGSRVAFRNLFLRELTPGEPAADAYPHETADLGIVPPPAGFTALFNGRDLTNWQGLPAEPNDNPLRRAELSPAELAAARQAADAEMRAHWTVADGVLRFDGNGRSLCTARDYGDFELLVDWKIEPLGDSGIYLRGVPQVQIWDSNQWFGIGSGGLYNNQGHPSRPLVCADRPVGQWNTFRIRMVGDRVTVHLNGVRVVDDVVLENYWDRKRPLWPRGPIELQSHATKLWFRNIFIRELH